MWMSRIPTRREWRLCTFLQLESTVGEAFTAEGVLPEAEQSPDCEEALDKNGGQFPDITKRESQRCRR